MSTKAEQFGKYLKKLRGSTPQHILASAIDKSAMYISNIEKGKNLPPDEAQLKKIAAALNLNNDKCVELIDEAAVARDTVAQDIVKILSHNKLLRQFIRDIEAGKRKIPPELCDIVK